MAGGQAGTEPAEVAGLPAAGLGMPPSPMQQVRRAGVEMGPLEGGPELGKSRDSCPVLEVRLGVVGVGVEAPELVGFERH